MRDYTHTHTQSSKVLEARELGSTIVIEEQSQKIKYIKMGTPFIKDLRNPCLRFAQTVVH